MTAFLVAFLILLVFLLFTAPARLCFQFILERDMNFSLTWSPLLKINAEMRENGVCVSVFLFGRKILSGRMLRRRKPGLTLWKSLSIRDTSLQARYGLNSPHLTGLMLAPVSALGFLPRIDTLEVCPDFFPEREYIRIDGRTSLNIGKTILNMIRAYFIKENNK